MQSPGSPKASAQALHFARSPGQGLLAECASFPREFRSGSGMEKTMSEITLFGFPRSVYVQMAGLVLTHKEVPYKFHDLEQEMGGPTHLALHPFDRVPILRHGDFTLYETSAIAAYIDEAFDGPKLTPGDPQQRGRMNQWISAVNAYYYPYLIYHVSHERNVFPQLGIPSDEKVVAHALPKVEICLQVLERELSGGKAFLLVARFSQIDGYRCLSLTRALEVVKCQSALVWWALRSCSQAAISSMRDCLSGMRRSRHWEERTPSSDSARLSQLPCFGV